jgi:hypothetical protein
MDIINAACHPSSEATALNWFTTLFVWLRNLPFEGPAQRCWNPQQNLVVQALYDRFKAEGSSHERELADHLERENVTPLSRWLTWSVFGWVLFWAAFLFAFPWSRTVQAIFFWNPKARAMLSLWFVPLLLLVVPLLRRRLLLPFRDDLIAPARLDDLDRLGFFSQMRVCLNGGSPSTIGPVLPTLSGAVVIRGDSGLGKTSALRWLAANMRRPVAFLPARSCADGVDVAIASLLHDVQETGFVRSMVYKGALAVIIDGLNEVSADTREKIRSFASAMSKGDVFVGTQPIDWHPPEKACLVDLIPLGRAEAKNFLLSRPIGSDTSQKIHGAAYEHGYRVNLTGGDDAPGAPGANPWDVVLSGRKMARTKNKLPYAAYTAAIRKRGPIEIGAKRAKAGTIASVIGLYLASAGFRWPRCRHARLATLHPGTSARGARRQANRAD